MYVGTITRKNRQRKQSSRAADKGNKYLLPERRRPGEACSSREQTTTDKEEAFSAVETAFVKRLESIKESIVKEQAMKKDVFSQQEFEQGMEKVRIKLESSKRIPKGIVDKADELSGYPEHCVSNSIGRGHDLLDWWRTCISEKWRSTLSGAWRQYQKLHDERQTRKPHIPRGDKERVCELSCNEAVRQNLPTEHKDLFLQRLEAVAIEITNMKADLLALVKTFMLKSARHGYCESNGTIKLDEGHT